MHNASKDRNIFYRIKAMPKTVIIKNTSLPEFLPHGWKAEVAQILGIHRNTVKNALDLGKGIMYEKIKHVAIQKWGQFEVINTEDKQFTNT